MKLGGNASLKAFLAEYGLDNESNVSYRYKTNASIYYRKELEAKVDKEKIDLEKPST